MQRTADLELAAWPARPQQRLQTSSRLLAGTLLACALVSAGFATWLPQQVSIVTVFLFAGLRPNPPAHYQFHYTSPLVSIRSDSWLALAQHARCVELPFDFLGGRAGLDAWQAEAAPGLVVSDSACVRLNLGKLAGAAVL